MVLAADREPRLAQRILDQGRARVPRYGGRRAKGDGHDRGAARDARRRRLDPRPGGTEDERLRPLALSPRPGLRSRLLFTQEQIEAELDALEAGQQEDGGWTFDFLAWCPGQALDWRGAVTLGALSSLRAHGRI
jgi:hypothetical protein